MSENLKANPAKSADSSIKILVPTNFSYKSSQALQFALRLSPLFVSSVEIYIFYAYTVKNRDFADIDSLHKEYMEKMKQATLDAIAALDQNKQAHKVKNVHRRLAQGRPDNEILKIASGIAVDLLVMGSPQGTTFRYLLENAPCTVVLTKEKDTSFVTD